MLLECHYHFVYVVLDPLQVGFDKHPLLKLHQFPPLFFLVELLVHQEDVLVNIGWGLHRQLRRLLV